MHVKLAFLARSAEVLINIGRSLVACIILVVKLDVVPGLSVPKTVLGPLVKKHQVKVHAVVVPAALSQQTGLLVAHVVRKQLLCIVGLIQI